MQIPKNGQLCGAKHSLW